MLTCHQLLVLTMRIKLHILHRVASDLQSVKITCDARPFIITLPFAPQCRDLGHITYAKIEYPSAI